ncbi:hypothetical protein BBJ28_00001761 [Nothophytophthora sp. Chile5]|nr:hypothetical protein BBJ28_00001761 [Nothophytophthora sp. Chile5]
MDRLWGGWAMPNVPARRVSRWQTPRATDEAPTTAPAALGGRNACLAGKKRAADGGESVQCEEKDAADRGAAGRGGGRSNAAQKPIRKRKHRKATHVIRREKEQLLKEMDVLNSKLADLKQQAIASWSEVGYNMQEKEEARKILRDGIQQQQLKFSEVAAIMSEFTLTNIQAGSPLQDTIFLKRERESRRQTLRGLKASKIQKGRHFLQLRRPNFDPRVCIVEDQRFETDSGDICSTRFTVTQFKGVQSVRQVFDLLLFYFCNIEISISEKIGHITVREDDDNGNKGIIQNRLVSTTTRGVKMESNTIMFSQYFDDPGESEYGLIVVDFVDDDERHPYQPGRRVRKDVNAAMEVRECSRSGAEVVVVLTRWVQNRLHYPKFAVERDAWCELRDHMDLWGQTIHRTMIEGLHA